MKDQDFKKLYGWESLCAHDCYSLWPHTHQFEKSAYPEKGCLYCVNEPMSLDAQCLQVAFGENKKILLNCYQCKKCGVTGQSEI